MIEAVLIVVILITLLLITVVVFQILSFVEQRKTNHLLLKDSTQAYLDAIKFQKTKKPFLSPTRNGKIIQEEQRPVKNDQEDGTNLLEMDPEDGYHAIMETMGVKE